MKKFLLGALMAFMLLNFGTSTEATEIEQENLCCGGSYYCASDSENYDGEYCGRYGCRR